VGNFAFFDFHEYKARLKGLYVNKGSLDQVRYVLAVAAGKGGVGKSTVAVNLALFLQKSGYQVGIFDADIYGPSLGVMMPLEGPMQVGEEIIPGQFHGVQAFSLAYASCEGRFVRAPVANGLILQCLDSIQWKELDYLIVDFPPGTGDIQLTLMQNLSFAGAVLVTTPQEVAVQDVRKAAHMFFRMGIPVVGVIENMSYFEDPIAGTKTRVFGEGGGMKIAAEFGIPLLGQIPISQDISRLGDLGFSWVSGGVQQEIQLFEDIVQTIRDTLFLWEQHQKDRFVEYVWKEMDR